MRWICFIKNGCIKFSVHPAIKWKEPNLFICVLSTAGSTSATAKTTLAYFVGPFFLHSMLCISTAWSKMIKKQVCFLSFSTMQTLAQACVHWSKYTTIPLSIVSMIMWLSVLDLKSCCLTFLGWKEHSSGPHPIWNMLGQIW